MMWFGRIVTEAVYLMMGVLRIEPCSEYVSQASRVFHRYCMDRNRVYITAGIFTIYAPVDILRTYMDQTGVVFAVVLDLQLMAT